MPEVSAIARDPETGVLLRARIDWWRHDRRIVDYKTTAKLADPAVFARLAFDYGYYLQDPTYRHVVELCGMPVAGFDFVIQETNPPYAVSVVHLGEASIELGRRRMREAIATYAMCRAAGEWPAYPLHESVEVDLPYWALRDVEVVADHDETVVDSAAIQLLESLN